MFQKGQKWWKPDQQLVKHWAKLGQKLNENYEKWLKMVSNSQKWSN
jgi:hypothetical protein